jgi:PAS domain S-box-containing protein
MSARRTGSHSPANKRPESALALPSLFPKAPTHAASLDSQAILLAELHHEMLFAITADRGVILDANPTALHLLNLEYNQIVGRRLADVLHRAEISQYISELPAGRPVRFTQRIELTGEDRPTAVWEFRVMRQPPPSDAQMLVTAHPLEVRRGSASIPGAQHPQSPDLQAMGQALAAASRRSSETDSPQPIFDWFRALPAIQFAALFLPTEGTGEFRIAFPATPIEGIPPTLPAGILGGDSARVLFADDSTADWIERSHAAAVILYPLGNADQKEILVLGLSDAESAGTILTLLSTFRAGLDPWRRETNRMMAQPPPSAALLKNRDALHALMDELPQALVLVNAKDGRVSEASLSCERMLGYSTPAMAAMPLENWLIAPEAVIAVRAACETGRIHESGELTLYRHGGESFPAHVRAIPLPAVAEERVHDVLVIVTDLTSDREVRQESRHLQRQAVLGWMAASFAHEIRNPLNNLSLQLEEMRTLHKLAPEVEKLAAESQNECQRLTEISRRMLDFARGQDFHPIPTDMAVLVRRVLLRMQPVLDRAGVRSLFSATEALPPAMADALSIEQVILNLIENAAKAMPEGGHLGVSLQLSALESGAPAVEVRVADTGQGLPAQVREKLFQPYVTTRADGHGLGLALSRHIIDAHRGALRAETYPGSGTVFRVFLPVASAT